MWRRTGLEKLLTETGTTSFIVLRGDEPGSRSIRGDIDSIDDPITTYVPERSR